MCPLRLGQSLHCIAMEVKIVAWQLVMVPASVRSLRVTAAGIVTVLACWCVGRTTVFLSLVPSLESCMTMGMTAVPGGAHLTLPVHMERWSALHTEHAHNNTCSHRDSAPQIVTAPCQVITSVLTTVWTRTATPLTSILTIQSMQASPHQTIAAGGDVFLLIGVDMGRRAAGQRRIVIQVQVHDY